MNTLVTFFILIGAAVLVSLFGTALNHGLDRFEEWRMRRGAARFMRDMQTWKDDQR